MVLCYILRVKYLSVTNGVLIFSSILIMSVSSYQAYASHYPILYVSAENPTFDNHFSGSMVVEVVVNDPILLDTDEGKGEPDVTINGKQLRIVQGADGKWYAYFANVNKAKIADQIVLDAGAEGESLDFGVFCSSDTSASVLGVSFSDTEGIAIPRSGGIMSATNGESPFTECTGSPTSSEILNNVVKGSKSLNRNSQVPTGQIGINQNVWPVIQLYSFDKVLIQYNRAGGVQQVNLQYDEIPNISLNLDRLSYPKGGEVFATINDMQLNQDPTSRDSWTFNIDSLIATFYQAFTETGLNSANGGVGLINLVPHLSSLGFEDNGRLTMNLGSGAELETNNNQPTSSVTDGSTTFSQIITFVESEPNSGIFENFDFDDKSTIGILDDAPRGKSAIIEYNSKSTSIVSGTFSGSISIGDFSPVILDSDSTAAKDPELGKQRVPSWIKDNAKSWSEGQIGDSDFVSVIQYMIIERVIVIADLPVSEAGEEQIPNWVKNNARWWAKNFISADDFVNGIKYLVEHGIIKVVSAPEPSPELVPPLKPSPPETIVGETAGTSVSTLDGFLQIEKTEYTISGYGYTEVRISGKVNEYQKAVPLTLTLLMPDGSTQELQVVVTSEGDFVPSIFLDKNWPLGFYKITAVYGNSTIGSLSFNVFEK